MDSWKVIKVEVTPSVAKFFVCSKCNKVTNGFREGRQEVMSDKVETVKGFAILVIA